MRRPMRRKHFTGQDVYTAALDRVRYLYKRFDNVVISFSGGKDSTAALNVVLEVARELQKLPVRAVFVDEEVIDPYTIEYVDRVRQHPDVQLDWYCLPVKHRNACSNEQPYWYCWHPEERELWVRDIPEWAITSHPVFEFGQSYQEWMQQIFPNDMGSVALVTGIRTQESLRRFQAIASKKNDAWIKTTADYNNCYRCHPIYDWSAEDVWKYVRLKQLDYNRCYDVFNYTDMHGKLLQQRVCQPFGEEPLRKLAIYAECFPSMWAKMVRRVKGVNTAYRYSNSELYLSGQKPPGITWQEYCHRCLEAYSDTEVREKVGKNIQSLVRRHFRKTNDELHDEIAHPVSGCSWRFLAKIAVKGDLKNRTQGKMLNEAMARCRQLGISLEEAKLRYGRS